MANKVIPIMCDCCGKEKMAEIKDNKLIIFDTRHGQRHFVVLDLTNFKKCAMVKTT